MNLWLLAFLVACFVDSGPPAVHAQGVFEDCCLAYHPHVKLAVLRYAWYYQHQEVSGSCNLPAVIFYFRYKQKMVCGNPRAKWVKNGVKLLDSRNKTHPKYYQGARRASQVSHSEGKKSYHSRLPLLMFRNHTRSS